MEIAVADVGSTSFRVEQLLEQQLGTGVLPFPNMNKSGSGVCVFFPESCPYGNKCPFRHVRSDRTIVCKHWLRGLCKKGDECEFLHEYDMTRMPECYFFSRFGECMNKECPFLHIDPASKIHDCAWYDRGFCRNGPMCKNRHVRRKMCVNYMNGFCPKGKECDLAHPKFWPPPGVPGPTEEAVRRSWTCHHCGEKGHKIQFCMKLPQSERQTLQEKYRMANAKTPMDFGGEGVSSVVVGGGVMPGQPQMNPHRGPEFLNHYEMQKHMRLQQANGQNPQGMKPSTQRSLEDVTCYKCGEKGHYANKCSKGYLAFLSRGAQNIPLPTQK